MALIPLTQVLLPVAAVAGLSHSVARRTPGVGIAMPVFVAPIAAARAGIMLGGDETALTAYVAGAAGVLLVADILRIDDIRRVGAPVASTGGAGTLRWHLLHRRDRRPADVKKGISQGCCLTHALRLQDASAA